MTAAKQFHDRLEEIYRLADAIDHQRADLVQAAADDAGFPVKVTSVEIDLAVEYLRTMQEEIPWVEKGRPFGTVATIFPYDAPVVVLARFGGAALLTGNRLRFSLSSQTPATAGLLARICESFTSIEPVVGVDNRAFGQRCVDDENIRLLFISGASAVGEAYRRQYRAFDKLFFAGPGGMPAAIVFEDAAAQKAAGFIARRAFINGGQYCTTLKKVYIHRSLYEKVRAHILGAVQKLKVGNPLDPATDIGPIRVARTRHLLQHALEQFPAARRVTGAVEGEMIFPLVLETENPQVPDLELFGPFLLLVPFDDREKVVSDVIQTRYGFLLTFFGSCPAEARALFRANFGMVHDNPDFALTPLRLPFGGKKASGWILERRAGRWVERDGAFRYSQELIRRQGAE